MAKTISSPPLSKKELALRAEQEIVVDRTKDGFVECGQALAILRDQKLYRVEFSTFAEYCRKRFDLGKSQTYRLMEAAEVAKDLSPIGDDLSEKIESPTTENQTRALAKAPKEKRAKVWEEAVKTAPKGKVTAAHVKKVVEKAAKQESTPAKSKESEAEPEPEPEFKDATGHVVTDPDVIAALAQRETPDDKKVITLKSLINEANAFRRKIESIYDLPTSRCLDRQSLTKSLKHIAYLLDYGMPFAECHASRDHKQCKACLGTKWVPEQIWKNLPKELR